MKNKYIASTLAFWFGMFGLHRFYLGNTLKGIAHFLLGMFGLALLIGEGEMLIILPAMIGFFDAILFLVMPKVDFNDRYNRKYLNHYNRDADIVRRNRLTDNNRYEEEDIDEEETYSSYREERDYLYEDGNAFKKTGTIKFNQHDYEGAIIDFQRALKNTPKDPGLHFNIACGYAMQEETMMALYHLDKAVELGYDKLDKIHRHSALSYLRTQPQFHSFVENGYQLSAYYDQVEDQLDEQPEGLELDNLIDQIKKLGELRAKGILTEEEFKEQKRKFL